MEVVADEEDLLNFWLERVDDFSCGDKARRGEQNALVIFDAIFTAFDVELVDDVRVCEKGDVEEVRGRGAGLLCPEFPG